MRNLAAHDGTTPFMVACSEGHIEIAKLLRECRVDISKKDNKGFDSLNWSIMNGKKELVDLLKKKRG